MATLLLGIIFHVIFCNEAQLHLTATGGDWRALSPWEQRRLAWSRGPVELWATARRLDTLRLVGALVLCGLPVFLGGLRWRIALRVQGLEIPFAEITRISFVAHFFNAFLLGSTGGDVVKAWYVARLTHHKRAEAALTVVVDRLLGTLALLLFAALMIPLAWHATAADPLFLRYRRYQAVALLVGGMAVTAAVLVAVGFYTDLLAEQSKFGRSFRRLPQGEGIARALAACRLFGRHRGFLRATAGFSLLINLSIVGTFLCLASGLGLEVPQGVLWFVVPAVVCVAALPITPSGLGVRENLFVSLLAIAAFPQIKHGEALALSLLGYTANLVWSAVGGLVYLFLPARSAFTHRSAAPAESADDPTP
jgi:uncharacterized membrane protein YbhN (UPF0104 family)